MVRRIGPALVALAMFGGAAATAHADGPGVGTPTIVAVGDSAISGEAGRWAGNTNDSSSKTDALGSSAYNDAGTGEAIPGCHRSKSAEVHIGGGVVSKNLACSGARTYTQPYDPESDFKPGIDFYNDGAGHIGQALALQQYAATHNVKAVTLLIIANNYGFADIVQTCISNCCRRRRGGRTTARTTRTWCGALRRPTRRPRRRTTGRRSSTSPRR